MSDGWRGAWVAALDELEADVDAIEKMIQDEHRGQELPAAAPWAPPAEIGPLPLELRPRADQIMARQIAAAQAIAMAITTNRRQSAFATRVEVGTVGKLPPSYVDCAM